MAPRPESPQSTLFLRLRWIAHDRHPLHARRGLLEQLQPFATQAEFAIHGSGGVAAGPCQAVDQAGSNRIACDWKHNRHGAGHLQQRPHRPGAMSQDDVGRSEANSSACLRISATWSRPSGCRSARCRRSSSPRASMPAGMLRCGPDIPRRPWLQAQGCRCAGSARPAARAPQSGQAAAALKGTEKSRRLN